MADFLDTFKRRESSEGSNIDDDEDEPHQFAREEINHQSDEEDNRPNERRNQNNDRSKPYQGEEYKDTRDQGQNRNANPANQAQNKKKDYYLYQGEEKPYESDQEEEGQGKGPKPKRENLKNKKKDPTYVPKGTFYQHDTRGDETEYVPKKSGGNQGKLKWRHDKFDKGGNKDNGYDQKEGKENPTFVNKQKEVVYYVVKGASEQKPAEEESQQQQQQKQQQQKQRQQQPREDRPQQQSRGKDYDYDKGGYGNDRDRGYNQNSGKYREYPKKDNYKKSGGNTGSGKQDVYYEYVPKESVSGGYDVRESKSDGNKSAEGKADPKKGPYNDMYSREGQKNKLQIRYQNPQNDANLYKATYPELYQRLDKESELLIHFYIKNISSFHPKNETYRKLHDALQQFGAVKEISLQRVNNDIYDFAVGMKYDEVAKFIFENDKLHSFVASLDRDNIKPYIESSVVFNFCLKSTPTEKSNYDFRKEGKHSISSHESHRRSGGYGQSEEDQRSDRNHDRSYDRNRDHEKRGLHQGGSAYGKKGRHGEDGSRSRSRSKSPSGRLASQVDKKLEYDPSKVYQVKDFLNKRKQEAGEISTSDTKTEAKATPENVHATGHISQYTPGRPGQPGQPSAEKPLMPGQRPEKPGPPSGQPGGGDHSGLGKDSAGKTFNPTPPFYLPPPNFPDPNLKTQLVTSGSKESGKGQSSSQVQPSQVIPVTGVVGAEPVIDYDNYCIFLGLPSELTELQILESLKFQGIEQPIKCEWIDESVTQYLRLGFKSDKTVKELILREINVGPTLEDLIYPVLILPWLKDKRFDDLLVYHQVQVESSIPVDSLFLDLFYSPYGPIADVIDMKPSKHVLIFTKQPHAQHVLSIPQISLQKNNIEIVMKHTVVDSCYPLVRKNLEAHQQTLMTRYMQSVQPSSLVSGAAQEVVEEEQKLDPLYQSSPHQIHREGPPSAEKYDQQYDIKTPRYPNDIQESPNYRYEDEGYYMGEKERGGNRPQYGGQPYRQDKYRYNEKMPPRNDYFDGNKRRDNPRNDRGQGYNPRFNQGQREGGEGYGGPGGRPYNNYQQYGRNQEPRHHHQYRQNISPEPRGQYQQGRNPDMRPQERGLDYRGHQGKGHDQRQQPFYPK